eukprot:9326888-Pyramimonas_sp.AAC.1
MEGQVRGLRSTFGHSPPSAACPLIPTEPRTLPRRRDSPAPRNHIDILRKYVEHERDGVRLPVLALVEPLQGRFQALPAGLAPQLL